jgi:hypothetical protein
MSETRHGTQVAYLTRKCRCPECVAWAKGWNANRRAVRGNYNQLVAALEEADTHLWHAFSCPAWTDPDLDEKPEGACECTKGRNAALLARIKGEAE